MQLLTIPQLRRAVQDGRAEALIHVQIDGSAERQTRDGKPYWEVTVADAEAKLTLRAWSDSPNFGLCGTLRRGDFLEIEGEFANHPAFGIEAKRWCCHPLSPEQIEALLGGPAVLREKQSRDFETIVQLVGTIADPRLHALCEMALADFGDRFRRTAAARNFHHARRGGLVEHVGQMLRIADQVARLYPGLNRDLLLAGVFFHDIGKLWENCPEPRGFGMPYDERGELIGHITIGIEVLNALWRKVIATEQAANWAPLKPSNEDVRNHLIHLIAAHHGEMQFGSPVFPKTPEAWALHHIDNLDAKLEMIFSGYGSAAPLADRIFERVRPLPGNLVTPLQKFSQEADLDPALPPEEEVTQ